MQERAANIFAYGDGEYVTEVGFCIHTLDGTPGEITQLLRSMVDSDHRNAIRYKVKNKVTKIDFDIACRQGPPATLLPGYEDEADNIIYCITHVVNGRPKVELIMDDFNESVPDYLRTYTSDAGFDFAQLINDDLMEPVKLLWNNRKYVSSLKLLLSMVDTLAFIEYGPTRDCFVRWLDEYCDLSKLEVNAEELWELRNSLLHMTNLESRKVQSRSVSRLMPAFGPLEMEIPALDDDAKPLHVSRFLLHIFPEGIENCADNL